MRTKFYSPDNLVPTLVRMGKMARDMPPSWDGARIAHIAAGPGGEYIGKILPGKGLLLDSDFKHYGITRQPPLVYERTTFRRILDCVNDERGAITTYDGIIAARGGGKAFDVVISKATFTTTANNWYHMGRATGLPGAMTFNATTAPTDTAPDRTFAGAWSIGLANPGGADKKYLLTLGFNSGVQLNMAVLFDLLIQSGQFRVTVTTEEIVAAPTALTRYTLGNGVLVAIVHNAATSATAHNYTLKYTNQAGTVDKTILMAMPATVGVANLVGAPGGLFSPFTPLANADFGVREIKSSLSSVALVAGNHTMLACFPLAFVPGVAANMYAERDSTIQVDGLTELVETAGGVLGCLNMFVLANSTSTGQFTAFMRTCDG